jgi:hypothetical protein
VAVHRLRFDGSTGAGQTGQLIDLAGASNFEDVDNGCWLTFAPFVDHGIVGFVAENTVFGGVGDGEFVGFDSMVWKDG